MAKDKIGIPMDPLSMLSSIPSFSGGSAAPSAADGTQSANISQSSSFAVGQGANASPSAVGDTGNLVKYALIALVVIAIVKAVRK